MTTRRPFIPPLCIGYPKIKKIITFAIFTELMVNLPETNLINYQKKRDINFTSPKLI